MNGQMRVHILRTFVTHLLVHMHQKKKIANGPLYPFNQLAVATPIQFGILINSCLLFRQSYDVEMEITVDGSNIISRNVLDLKNPYFRYTGAQTSPPTGSNTTSPTETYWSSIPNNVGSSLNIVNHELAAGGVLGNGAVSSNAGFGMGGVNSLGLQGTSMHY